MATGFPYDIRERLPETLARLGRILGVVQGLRRGGSAALDMSYVACGRFDGFYRGKPQALGHRRGAAAHRGGGRAD